MAHLGWSRIQIFTIYRYQVTLLSYAKMAPIVKSIDNRGHIVNGERHDLRLTVTTSGFQNMTCVT